MEDEFVRTYIGRILEITLGIKLKEEPKVMIKLYGRY